MIADSTIVPECIFRPRSFTGLMTLYESNYIKLSHLIAEFDSFPEAHSRWAVSSCEEDCDLYLAVQRRRPYTTTLKLTYLFSTAACGPRRAVAVPEPDLRVRVYHDARLVEAQRVREQIDRRVFPALTRVYSRELDRRWRNNMLLNKWLDYLLEMGHRFASR